MHRTVQRSATLSIAIAAALAIPAHAASGRAIKGDGFTTKVPSGWSSRTVSQSSDKVWLFGSPGAKLDSDLGIPTKGGIGVSADVAKATTVERLLGAKLATDPVQLLRQIAGTPDGVTHVKRAEAAHAITLGGEKAAAGTVTYTYKKRAIVQRDVIARRGSKLYFIELDVDQANAAKGRTALSAILAAWTFTN